MHARNPRGSRGRRRKIKQDSLTYNCNASCTSVADLEHLPRCPPYSTDYITPQNFSKPNSTKMDHDEKPINTARKQGTKFQQVSILPPHSPPFFPHRLGQQHTPWDSQPSPPCPEQTPKNSKPKDSHSSSKNLRTPL